MLIFYLVHYRDVHHAGDHYYTFDQRSAFRITIKRFHDTTGEEEELFSYTGRFTFNLFKLETDPEDSDKLAVNLGEIRSGCMTERLRTQDLPQRSSVFFFDVKRRKKRGKKHMVNLTHLEQISDVWDHKMLRGSRIMIAEYHAVAIYLIIWSEDADEVKLQQLTEIDFGYDKDFSICRTNNIDCVAVSQCSKSMAINSFYNGHIKFMICSLKEQKGDLLARPFIRFSTSVLKGDVLPYGFSRMIFGARVKDCLFLVAFGDCRKTPLLVLGFDIQTRKIVAQRLIYTKAYSPTSLQVVDGEVLGVDNNGKRLTVKL